MDSRYHRSPSPGHPVQHGYQLDDNPYGSHQNLQMPMGPSPVRYDSPADQLPMNNPVSPECALSRRAKT